MTFKWLPVQEQTNIHKQGINFTEASNALLDPDCRIVLDEEHSTLDEIRYHYYGWSGLHFLLVNFTVLNEDLEVIRIIDLGK